MSAVVAPDWFESPQGLLSDRVPVAKPEPRDQRIYTLSARNIRPSWVDPTASRITELLTLPPDWDSYGAQPVRSERARALWQVLVAAMAPGTPSPAVVPVADGSIQAEWHTGGIDLEIEATGPATVRVYFRGHGVEWEKVLSVDLTDVVDAIDEVTP